MEIVYLLIPVSLVLVGVIVAGFLWAARAGQFDDLERRGSDILLHDDDRPANGPPEEGKSQSEE